MSRGPKSYSKWRGKRPVENFTCSSKWYGCQHREGLHETPCQQCLFEDKRADHAEIVAVDPVAKTVSFRIHRGET